jgi:GNAT superfamily N-acetyltransferase
MSCDIATQHGDKVLPLTLANFYVFHPSNLPKTFSHPVGHGYLSIKGEKGRVAKIEDLKVNPNIENRGIGSALLRLMESWARYHGVNKLIGDLSNVDADHVSKLSYFYRKNGYDFQLHATEKKTSSIFKGKVEKKLS